jgi:hypothetical protein
MFEKVETRLEQVFGTNVRESYAAAMETVQHRGLTALRPERKW